MMGVLGLNTVPDARMDKPGTVRTQASALDPYLHGVLGVQVSKSLYLGVRQTAEVSSLGDRADRLYPGLDMKLRLMEETGRRPAVALGLQSALGDRRMAAEYIVASKRFGDFDVSGGLGWGRMGSKDTFGNPFHLLSRHFKHGRDLRGENPNGPDQWFTGNAGVFGGVAWDSPLKGLKLKADWNADAYLAEKADPGFHAPKPWSFGFSYAPVDWATIGTAMVGTHKALATISLQWPLDRWFGKPAQRKTVAPFPAHRSGNGSPAAIDIAAAADNIIVESAAHDDHTLTSLISLRPGASFPMQIGEVAGTMARHGGRDVEAYEIQPAILGLKGPSLKLMRRDLEDALASGNGSPQEIWRQARFGPMLEDAAFPDGRTLFNRPYYFGVIVDTKASLSENDHGALYRTGIILEARHMLSRHIMMGEALRINIAGNLHGLHGLRPRVLLPVRSDEDAFAARTVWADKSYLAWMKSLNADWHIVAAAGYLEEMYAGLGGEVLYRPYGRTYAFGAEAWEALKRDPLGADGFALNGDHLLSGHIKAWYEIPGTGMTVQAKIGRYLAEDFGGTLSLSNRFRNGASVEAFATMTSLREADVFGGATNLTSGLRFRLPLGSLPALPDGSETRFAFAPIGRDSGQSIENPVPLYDLTDQVSYRAVTDHWGEIADK